MRKIREDELEKVTEHMLEIFFEEIEMTIATKGIETAKAKKIMYETLYADMEYFYKYGEIFTYDDDFSGILTLINGKKFSIFKKTFLSLKSNKKMIEIATKEELKILNENAKKLQEVHSFNWYKKYKPIPFYLAHIGIHKDKRGNGIFRRMLEFLFEYVRKYNNEIVLETFNIKNVRIYEHFGFEVIKTVESEDKILTQYRMIKKL